MQNFVQYSNTANISATTTFGYAPGQTIPTRLNILNPTGGITITLPPSTSTVPTVPGANAQPTPGATAGWDMIFYNTTSQTITFAASASDTNGIIGTPSINTANSHVRLSAMPANLAWYVVG
jgi:hypothetical protein